MAERITNPELNKTGLLDIIDQDANSTMLLVRGIHFCLPKNKVDSYRKEARSILDRLSKDFNPMGIDALMAALIIEVQGNEYNGIKNPKRSK